MTASEARARTPAHLWIIGVIALLWNAMGAFDYLATKLQLGFYMSEFTEAQLEYFYGFPAWVTAFWALAVWGALAGSIGLLLRKKWSVWAFAASAAASIITSIYNFGMTNGAEIMGDGALTFSIVIWVIAFFLLWYSWWLSKRGVLAWLVPGSGNHRRLHCPPRRTSPGIPLNQTRPRAGGSSVGASRRRLSPDRPRAGRGECLSRLPATGPQEDGPLGSSRHPL